MTSAPFSQKRELGQHFLVDENILGVIGRLAEIGPRDVVLEVGPGLGVLTVFLADRVGAGARDRARRDARAVSARAPRGPHERRAHLHRRAQRRRSGSSTLRRPSWSPTCRTASPRRSSSRASAASPRSACGACWCSARSPTASSPSPGRRRTEPFRSSFGSLPSEPASIRSRARASVRRRTSTRRSLRSAGGRTAASGVPTTAGDRPRRLRAPPQDARELARAHRAGEPRARRWPRSASWGVRRMSAPRRSSRRSSLASRSCSDDRRSPAARSSGGNRVSPEPPF